MSAAAPPVPQTAIHGLVEAARHGDARVIARMPSGWAMFGERQFVNGYALLLPDPVVPGINSLARQERSQFLLDMTQLGDALLCVTGALRINYAIFGNLEPALHAHVVPRYADEPAALRTAHPWAYDWDAARKFEPRAYADLALALRGELARSGAR
jgi:diadenosine tetraphosphate (Ap4A) HIT family hydrolase